MPATFTAIHLTESGEFREVTLGRSTPAALLGRQQTLLGAARIASSTTAFSKPFIMLCDESGMLNQAPTALIVDPHEVSGVSYLYGSALFFRRAGASLRSTKTGDIELLKSLPMWLRFNNLEARNDIPNADRFTRSGAKFTPQLHIILTGPERQRVVFRNALWATFEYQILAYHLSRIVNQADSIELMLQSSAVAAAKKFVEDGLDDKGRFKKPWAALTS